MTKDIGKILRDWDYAPGHINARWISGDDGQPRIQLRLDLGVLQMMPEDRPDGKKPFGFASLLDYYLHLEENTQPDHPALDLNPDACMALLQEAVQFYYRYISFSALGYLDGVIADTEHSLQIFELIARHADDDEIVWQFFQFFPYVRMMNARAVSEKAVEEKNFDEAIEVVEAAIDDVRDFLEDFSDFEEDEVCDELLMLQDMLDNLKKRKPKTKLERLQENLDRAIAVENYERAALIRDELNKIQIGADGDAGQPAKTRQPT